MYEILLVSISLVMTIMVSGMVNIRVKVKIRVNVMLKILVSGFYRFSAYRKKSVRTFMVLFLIKALVSSLEGK